MTEIRILVSDETAALLREKAQTIIYCASRRITFSEAVGLILTRTMEEDHGPTSD